MTFVLHFLTQNGGDFKCKQLLLPPIVGVALTLSAIKSAQQLSYILYVYMHWYLCYPSASLLCRRSSIIKCVRAALLIIMKFKKEYCSNIKNAKYKARKRKICIGTYICLYKYSYLCILAQKAKSLICSPLWAMNCFLFIALKRSYITWHLSSVCSARTGAVVDIHTQTRTHTHMCRRALNKCRLQAS